MNLKTSKKFNKSFLKLNPKIKLRFKERRNLFIEDPTARILNVHKLSGEYNDMWSINITGDYRAILEKQEKNIIFIDVGRHKDLFE